MKEEIIIQESKVQWNAVNVNTDGVCVCVCVCVCKLSGKPDNYILPSKGECGSGRGNVVKIVTRHKQRNEEKLGCGKDVGKDAGIMW